MNKETLARAKELEKDIQQMESALSYYKRGKWSNWDWQNDRASSFHFEFCKNWGHESFNRQDLPTWINKPLMEVVERELERCKHELETLTDDSAEIITDVPEAGRGEWQPCKAYQNGDRSDYNGSQYECQGEFKPTDISEKASWKDNAVRTIDRLISWMLYSMTFCFLLGVAGLDLSAREIIAYSLMLGLVVGSINNIERVMRELFKKED
jgi:hypothetical protein